MPTLTRGSFKSNAGAGAAAGVVAGTRKHNTMSTAEIVVHLDDVSAGLGHSDTSSALASPGHLDLEVPMEVVLLSPGGGSGSITGARSALVRCLSKPFSYKSGGGGSARSSSGGGGGGGGGGSGEVGGGSGGGGEANAHSAGEFALARARQAKVRRHIM